MPAGRPTPRPGSTTGGKGHPGNSNESTSNSRPTIRDEQLKEIGQKVAKAAFAQLDHEKSTAYIPTMSSGPPPVDTDAINKEVAWIAPRFEHFIKPFPRDFVAVLDALDDAISRFPRVTTNGSGSGGMAFTSEKFPKVSTAEGNLAQWEGALTRNLRDWLTALSPIVTNQAVVLSILRDNLWAMREIYIKAREDVHEIGERAVTAFENCKSLSGSDSIGIILTVLAAFAGIASAGLGFIGKAQASLSGAVISGGLGIGPGVTPEKGEELPLSGNHAKEVMDKLAKALDEVETKVKEKEGDLIKSMDENSDILSKFVSRSNTVPNPIAPITPEMFGASPKELKDGFTQSYL